MHLFYFAQVKTCHKFCNNKLRQKVCIKKSLYRLIFVHFLNLSQVPRHASQVSNLNVARLGLNDGAQLQISFKLFSNKTNPLLCKSLICVIKNVCFENFLKEIHSCAPSFNPRLATFNALPKDARQGTSLRFCRIRLPLLQFYSNSVPNNSLDFLWRLGPQLIVCITC